MADKYSDEPADANLLLPFHREVDPANEKTKASHFAVFLKWWIYSLYKFHIGNGDFDADTQLEIFLLALDTVTTMGYCPFQVYQIPYDDYTTQTFYFPAGITPPQKLASTAGYGGGYGESFSHLVNFHHITQKDNGPIIAIPRSLHYLTYKFGNDNVSIQNSPNLLEMKKGRNMLHRPVAKSQIDRAQFKKRVIQALNEHYERTQGLPRYSDGIYSPYGGTEGARDQFNTIVSQKGTVPKFDLLGIGFTPEKKK
jgi:hypothetical protein